LPLQTSNSGSTLQFDKGGTHSTVVLRAARKWVTIFSTYTEYYIAFLNNAGFYVSFTKIM